MYCIIERHFILIILAFSAVAMLEPSCFTWLKPYITLLLGIILFGIGFTLDSTTVKKTLERRWTIFFAIMARYLLMPTAAYLIGKVLQLSTMELIGLVILGTCPGGTAANVMSYLSRGNIALTVILTFGTTLLAPFAMPTLVYFFLHEEINVPYWGMLTNILLVVFIPLAIVIFVKKYCDKFSKRLIDVFPTISIFAISLAIACIIALSQEKIRAFPFWIISAVLLLNLAGYFFGFLISKSLHCNPPEQKSILFEFGMFDAALGIIIATHFFGPVAALPSAFLSIIQNITASAFVRIFRYTKYHSKDRGSASAAGLILDE